MSNTKNLLEKVSKYNRLKIISIIIIVFGLFILFVYGIYDTNNFGRVIAWTAIFSVIMIFAGVSLGLYSTRYITNTQLKITIIKLIDNQKIYSFHEIIKQTGLSLPKIDNIVNQLIKIGTLNGHIKTNVFVPVTIATQAFTTSTPTPTPKSSIAVTSTRISLKGSYKVFVSHSSKDNKIASRIVDWLEQHEIKCWVSPRDIPPGKDWMGAILGGLELCEILVFVYSQNANDSKHIRRELKQADKQNMSIIPIRIEDVVYSKDFEYILEEIQWLDATEGTLESHLDQLLYLIEAN